MKAENPVTGISDEPRSVASTSEVRTPRRNTTTPSRVVDSFRNAVTPTSLQRHHTQPVTIAERGGSTPGSTSRFGQIQRAMTMASQLNSPGIPTSSKKKYREVADEDTDTDVDTSTQPSPRSASFQDQSSQSQRSSLFSYVSVGSNSLGSSFSNKVDTEESDFELVIVHDVFDPVPRTNLSADSRQTETVSLSPDVLRFARSPFGTDLEVMVIAHSREAQKIMDDNQIAWGVQYEIARGVGSGLWTWDGLQAQVEGLKGKNSEAAYRVEMKLKGRGGLKRSDMHIWSQLDLEQDAILENIGRGLGLMGNFQGTRDWYGGKIQQRGCLVKDGSSYKIKLEKMESRRSHRFARYYGSRRFLHIRVAAELIQKGRNEIKKFFRRKFVLCGRIFVAFHAKERNVYLVETNEDYGRSPQEWCGDHLRYSFNQFINWHNPLEVAKNTQQVITKYTARFALGLSNSKPALEFEEKNIFFISDITADDWPQGHKAPAHKLMTDGCGILNHAALQSIVRTVGYEFIPAGIQGRIGGSKGFFILHPTDNSSEPKIWIRDSQNKIQHATFDRANRILDLLCASQLSQVAALTQQSIVNLSANGVHDDLLVRLMEQGLEEEVAPLLQWDRPHAALFLYDAISKCGGVTGVRAQRIAYSLNRVLGFKARDWHDDDGLVGEDDEDEDEQEAFTERNEYSGAPLSLHELAIELLQSGFDPKENKLLQDKIGYIIDTVARTAVEKYRIPVPESAMSFIVPDPLGILEEGEVFYRFSRPRKDPETDLLQYALEGEILVGRYPIRLPSDIQRVTAVFRRELDRWPDVLVVSVKGKRSLASLLADGDMDGGRRFISTIVNLFKNRSFTEQPQNFIENNFKRDVESVEEFCVRISGLPSTREAHEAFQDVLVSNLNESIVGLYSMFHENACLKHGYDGKESIRLAYIFATLLDSSKNGCRLKDRIFKEDKDRYRSKYSGPRNIGVGENGDILTTLKSAGDKKAQELKQLYRGLGQIDKSSPRDECLCMPFDNASKTARKISARGFKGYTDELDKIRLHVEAAYSKYKDAKNAYWTRKDSRTASIQTGQQSRKNKKEDLWLHSARVFAEGITGLELIQNVEEVKASCAYVMNADFGFHVAFRRLCLLKAESKPGGCVPSLRVFDEGKKVSSSFLKALEWAEEDYIEEPARL